MRRAAEKDFQFSCEPLVGQMLAMLAAAAPRNARILELGTGAGVGTAWLAHGVDGRPDVRIVTVEQASHLAEAVAGYRWPRSVEFRVGDAEALLPELGTFDLVFADAEGGKWSGLELTVRSLRLGGVLVVDDMDLDRYPDPAHKAHVTGVRQALCTDRRLLAVELAVGSGVIVASRATRSD
ncbi:O-methyltransferase [Micromonospora sp. NPDC050397]|uniref:O-methyltransferase n=1 Tax=Micromonospora sp. NPDC050397 TaxID=3364279 RepID=UPI00384E3B5D